MRLRLDEVTRTRRLKRKECNKEEDREEKRTEEWI